MYLVKQVLAQCSNSSKKWQKELVYILENRITRAWNDWLRYIASWKYDLLCKTEQKSTVGSSCYSSHHHEFLCCYQRHAYIYVRYVPALLFHNLKQIKKGGSLLKGHTPLLIGIISCAQQEINEECTKILLC